MRRNPASRAHSSNCAPAEETGLPRDCKAQAEQVRSVAVERVRQPVGFLTPALASELGRGPDTLRDVRYDWPMDGDKIEQVLREFHRLGVEYKVFGGVALNLHGLPRFTEDLDVFVAPRAENIEVLKTALRQVFEDPGVEEISTQELLGDYPAVQYVPPAGDFHIDILTRLGEAFDFDGLSAEDIDFRGLAVQVVTPRQLYEMKRDTVRLRDRADAELLNERFGLEG